MQASIVIRTLNEARYLDALLTMIAAQETDFPHEVVLVDSGSTDGTVQIARDHGARIVTIDRAEFSFGRSLNRGCAAATGDMLVMISGHCVPVGTDWLQRLCQPLIDGVAGYAYGGQLGGPQTQFSEHRIFAKYFPAQSRIPQDGFFCNNANSVVTRAVWERFGFDEELTGLEDMALAKLMVGQGGRVAYVAEAAVYHYHAETWAQVKRRFEREAIALRQIMPDVALGRRDMWRYIASSVRLDFAAARRQGTLARHWRNILRYRVAQYTGSYKGHNDHRRLSRARKDAFFYPATDMNGPHDDHRPPADESQQPKGQRQELSPPAR